MLTRNLIHAFSARWTIQFILLISLLILIGAYFTTKARIDSQLQQFAEANLSRLEQALKAELARHEYLPAVLAENDGIKHLLAMSAATQPKHEEFAQLQSLVNAQLQAKNLIAQTSEIYVMSAKGVTIASSNWDAEIDKSFVGKNFSFRPYFQQAMQGRLGRYFAMGTTSGQRGYYFAKAVKQKQGVKRMGVVVVKVNIERFERDFQNPAIDYMVTDNKTVVFLSDNNKWLMHSLKALDLSSESELRLSKRYAGRALKTLSPIERVLQNNNGINSKYRLELQGKQYFELSKPMIAEGWNIHVLIEQDQYQRQLMWVLLITFLIVTLLAALFLILKKYFDQRRQYILDDNKRLESKVEARTNELKRAQEELIQAAKMAALGQLSAGINHELNNPLTAIRVYADNASQFLQLNNYEQVQSNLAEISELTQKMAAITHQLKAFSRKSEGKFIACDLKDAVQSSLSIVKANLKRQQVVITEHYGHGNKAVVADLLWLEQIVINLLSNAMEATQDQEERRIDINTMIQDDEVLLTIADNGAGIDAENVQQIFEAFFTTKSSGKGLGLGLSISYRLAKDMKGMLSVKNQEQGAMFILALPQYGSNYADESF